MLTADHPDVQRFLTAWHENGRAAFERDHTALVYDTYRPKVAKERKRFLALDVDTSGCFLVDRDTTMVYSIKGYGVPNRALGALVDVTAAYEYATQEGRDFGYVGYVASDGAIRTAATSAHEPAGGDPS